MRLYLLKLRQHEGIVVTLYKLVSCTVNPYKCYKSVDYRNLYSDLLASYIIPIVDQLTDAKSTPGRCALSYKTNVNVSC